MTQTVEGQDSAAAAAQPKAAPPTVDTNSSKSATEAESAENVSPPAEHVTSDADVANQSDSPNSNSPNDGSKKTQRRRQLSAKTASLLADPAALLEIEALDDQTKQTQCSIPFQRSTFLVVDGSKQEPKTPTKSTFRFETWNFMEKNNIAASPRPVTRRIPNFKESDLACEMVAELSQFKDAQTVVVGPDRPQQKLRYLTLKEGKTLLVPTSRIASGLFNKINPPQDATDEQIALCATSEGVRTFSTPVGLDDEVKVDLVVMGCAVVTRKGRRLGKGEGFADLEWAMMVAMGAVTLDTTVVTCVHDCQIKDDIPEDLFQEYDLPVDVIVSPTQTLIVESPLKKPSGIMWSKVSERKLERVPILKQLREKEQEKGVDVTLAAKPQQNTDSVSYIGDENEVDKSCQTNQGRRSGRSFNGGRFQRRQRRGGPEARNNRQVRRRRNFSQRKRDKSEVTVTEDDAVDGSNKASAGSGDAAAVSKKVRQRRNQRREKSGRKRGDSRRGNTENDTEGGETSVKGEENNNSGAEESNNRASGGGRNRNRRQRRSGSEVRDNDRSADNRGPRGGGRRFNGGGGGGGGYYGMRAPMPWMNPYDMPPHARYNAYYPPYNEMRGGGRYGSRSQGYFGPPLPPPMMGGGRRGGPPGGRPNEFVPASMKPAVFVGDIPVECGEDMFGDVLEDRKVRPTRMIWQKNEKRTFLVFDSLGGAQDCVRKLKNLYINDEACRVDLSNMTKRNYFL